MNKFIKYNTIIKFCLLLLVPIHSASMEQPDINSVSNYPSLNMHDSLLILYRGSYQALPLYINKKELPGSYADLKTLFAKNNVVAYNYPKSWTDNTWKTTHSYLRDQKIDESNMINFSELSSLLEDAKRIVKFLLLDNNNRTSCAMNDFIQKALDDKLNRLFTYSYLQQVINAKKLAHIRLPRKILLIQDKKTKECLANKEAQKVVDDTLKIYVYSSPVNRFKHEVNFAIKFDSDEYELKFFAHKESKTGSGFNTKAFNELGVLCKEAPFDVGDDNIFWDEKGDAIIIDTEYKGESSSTACPKLTRYPIDKSL